MNDFEKLNGCFNCICVNDGIVSIRLGWFNLSLYIDSALRTMSLRDFKKMLRVCRGLLDCESYVYYLSVFNRALNCRHYANDYKIARALNAELDKVPARYHIPWEEC